MYATLCMGRALQSPVAPIAALISRRRARSAHECQKSTPRCTPWNNNMGFKHNVQSQPRCPTPKPGIRLQSPDGQASSGWLPFMLMDIYLVDRVNI